MEKEKKNKKKQRRKAIGIVIAVLLGLVIGFGTALFLDTASLSSELGDWMVILITLVSFLLGFYLQIIIHEGGHLIFGLLSGYKFSSFRIGSFMLAKKNGKFEIKRLHLAGTGGQCLMDPPEMKDEKIPYVLYNMGGVLMNLLSALLCLILLFVLPGPSWLLIALVILGVLGVAVALMNGIPLNLSSVANDGYNVMMLSKSKEALRAFYSQMKVSHLSSQGIRLKDMPAGVVYLPVIDDWSNPLISAVAVFFENRLNDQQDYEHMAILVDELLDLAELPMVYTNLLKCDGISWALIKGNAGKANKYQDRELQVFMKQMKDYPTILRTQYVQALLTDHDEEKANKIKEKFEKRALTYPNSADLFSERALMDKAEEAFHQLQNTEAETTVEV